MRRLVFLLLAAFLFSVVAWFAVAPIQRAVFGREGVYDLVAWGADPTGQRDSSSAVSNVLAKCEPRCVLRFQAGKYKFASMIKHKFSDRRSSISVVGDGTDVSILNWVNSDGGMAFVWSNIANSLHVRDLTFTTSQESGGTALSLINTTNWPGYQIDTQKEIERVSFRGDDGADAQQYWTRAVYVQAVNYVNFNGILTYGGGDGATKRGYGIVLTDAPGVITANFNIVGSSFLQLDTGLLTINDPQGIAVTNSTFVDNEVGIATQAGSTELQGMLITASNFNNRRSNVSLLTQVNDLQITGNTFIVHEDDPPPSFNVVLGSVARFTVTGNNVIAFAGVKEPALRVDQTHGWPGVIANNNFSGPFATAIELTSNASRISIQGNAFGDTIKSRVANAGQHSIIDVAQTWAPVLSFGDGKSATRLARQTGSFARYGDLVVAMFRISLEAVGTGRGVASVAGFPVGAIAPTSGTCAHAVGLRNATGLGGYVNGNVFQFTLPAASGVIGATDENFTDKSDVACTVTYLASP